MTAYPWVVDATGFVSQSDPGQVQLLVLFENKEIEGHTVGTVKFTSYKFEGGVSSYDPDVHDTFCPEVTRWNLKNRMKLLPAGARLGIFNFGSVSSDYCKDPGCYYDCVVYNWVRVSFLSDIPIRAYSPTQPALPNITVTPMNGALNIKWDPVTNVNVFSYYVAVLDGTNFVEVGDTENTLRDITIGNLTNGKTYTVRVAAVSHSNVIGQVAQKTAIPVGATSPVVYDLYTTPDAPVAGASFTISARLANTGPSGKVRAVFKVGGTPISDQNSTLNTFPGGGLWGPTAPYTMPNSTITITVEAYGWDGTKWVLTDTKSISRTPAVTPCSGVTLTPFSASIQAGEKVTFTAAVTPSTSPFTVQFKDRAGTLLGTCTASGGSCTYIWDSTGKPAGSYYVKAYVTEGNCVSTESVILVSPALRQWNVNIYVKDSVTATPVSGATVTIGTQSKATDATGLVMFRVDEGTIDISISKTGYNTKTTVELVFTDKTFNYSLSPTGIAKGNIHFVTVPTGADVYLDGNTQGVKTPVTVIDIPSGEHTFTLKLAGYNDLTGPVTVVGGSTVEVYADLTPSTPGAGSLYINSIPVGADVTIDGQLQTVKTPATITNLTAGSHEVKLTKTGYEDLTKTVTITAGTTTYLNVSLTVLPGIGTLEISSTPAGARVFIDGADAQKVTPATITNLSSGDHTYKLVLSGYKDATGTATIEPGKTTTVSVPLTKAEAKAGAGMFLGISLLGLGVIGAVVIATREQKPEYTLPGLRRNE